MVEVGDYVEYHPTASTCNLTEITGVEQEPLTPSATTQWRVLSNDGTTVELVSADTVGTLTLGSASDATISKTHYANIVQILKQISEAYVDSSVATGGRGLGWNGTSAETIPVENISYSYISENGITVASGDPFDDTYYQTNSTIADIEVLKEHNMLHTSTHSSNVWLASRGLDVVGSFLDLGVRDAFTNGFVENYYLFREQADGVQSYEWTDGVRPVVILKSDLKDITGAGTSTNPWKLN